MGFLDTDSFYRQSCEAGYVKLEAVARNIAWTTSTRWGDIEITINRSKPEKDPKAIAAAAGKSLSREKTYVDPATGRERSCPLCVEDADVECGYARPISIAGEKWGLWYSPYAYYDEHCIAMSWAHRPMHIDRAAFAGLFDVVDLLPCYFFGSNADLPIVGGSILGHDHFQGGLHTFPMQEAPVDRQFDLSDFTGVQAGIVRWPVSVIRIEGADRVELIDAACHVLDVWCSYNDPQAGIVSGVEMPGRDAGSSLANVSADVNVGAGIESTVAISEREVSIAADTESNAEFAANSSAMTANAAGARPFESAAAVAGDVEVKPAECIAEAADVATFSESADGVTFSEGGPKGHNTITPILRKQGDAYQLDLALRCNIASAEHPLGVFHPHERLHHIKKENIGLIEVMGLAILPPRVQQVMEERGLTRDDVGNLFAQVLECAGVFKWDDEGRAAFDRFVARL